MDQTIQSLLCHKQSVEEISQEIIDVLNLNEIENKIDILRKLVGYRLVKTIDDIDKGKYIRWISLSQKNPTLTNGGIVLDVKTLSEKTHIICKNNIGRIIQVILEHSIVFQKMSEDELLILHAKKMMSQL
jgi:hypothetical protein